jgi:TetR/AcrR family transcriptional repressor of nem operon
MAARLAADTAEQILDAAERRAQTVGYHGFSYADVAGELSLTTASVHYHFPAKADLGARLIERYTSRFLEALADIEARASAASDRLRAYVQIYEDVVAANRMCLCGMLASEYETLPVAMRERLGDFFAKNQAWVTALLTAGRASGELSYAGDPKATASALVSALEGAMLVAKAHGGLASFKAAAQVMLGNLIGPR